MEIHHIGRSFLDWCYPRTPNNVRLSKNRQRNRSQLDQLFGMRLSIFNHLLTRNQSISVVLAALSSSTQTCAGHGIRVDLVQFIIKIQIVY